MNFTSRHPVNRSVVVATASGVETVGLAEVTAEHIGVKGMGLLRLPPEWVPLFFVISGDAAVSQQTINMAAKAAGLSGPEVYIRSSGTRESMAERGSLESRTCDLSNAAGMVAELRADPKTAQQRNGQTLHFIAQERVASREQGHLSNERRLSRHYRDWHAEIEGEPGLRAVAVREWRNASSTEPRRLECDTSASIPRALRSVAAWLGNYRAHFEWIWDGTHVWIVQMDSLAPSTAGISPQSLVSKAKRPKFHANDLTLFVRADDGHFARYGKLRNAKLYGELQYTMPDFFVMSDVRAMRAILDEEIVVPELERDLEKLCQFPFVIRTDATGLEHDQRQMLPRSDELRSVSAAIKWLLTGFRSVVVLLSNAESIVLIGHHFVPAAASAWAQARPGERRVRIESLWGIPEGSYYFAHDVFDVDTGHVDIAQASQNDGRIVSDRQRYKGKFIAPTDAGEWTVHRSDEASDWSRSIRMTAWIREIAWSTRRIAERVGEPIVAMWLIDVPKAQSVHRVLPWYHEGWQPSDSGYTRAQSRKKLRSAEYREITSKASWQTLKADIASGLRVERVFINPDDCEIVRDREFINDLATHAKANEYVVELSGGLLSHAFYMLSRAGCNVECVDLFATQDEQLEFNKIVRDKIPANIQERGETLDVVTLSGNALLEALKRKLVEEALEAFDADTADAIIEELADVQEVIDGVIGALGVDRAELNSAKEKKKRRRGGFHAGQMLVRTRLAPSIQPQLPSDSKGQVRSISVVEELPRSDTGFHVDLRHDSSGMPERQLTMTLPADGPAYESGHHRFDLVTSTGERHDMYFSAQLDRTGAILKLKVRLTNAATQLALPFPAADSDDK